MRRIGKTNEIFLPVNMTQEEWVKTREDIEVLKGTPFKSSNF